MATIVSRTTIPTVYVVKGTRQHPARSYQFELKDQGGLELGRNAN
jgi:hypothetical protein